MLGQSHLYTKPREGGSPSPSFDCLPDPTPNGFLRFCFPTKSQAFRAMIKNHACLSNSLLMTVLVEWTMLSICSLTPGCSPKPREDGSEAQPTVWRHCKGQIIGETGERDLQPSPLARNLLSCRTQMALTTRSPASSSAQRVNAMLDSTIRSGSLCPLLSWSWPFT